MGLYTDAMQIAFGENYPSQNIDTPNLSSLNAATTGTDNNENNDGTSTLRGQIKLAFLMAFGE